MRVLLIMLGLLFAGTTNADVKQLTCSSTIGQKVERIDTFLFDAADLKRDRPSFQHSYRLTSQKCNSIGCSGETLGYMYASPTHISFFAEYFGSEIRVGYLNRKDLGFQGVYEKGKWSCVLEDYEVPENNLI